jgi:uncharacterized repeat protein (TIGR03803 family)
MQSRYSTSIAAFLLLAAVSIFPGRAAQAQTLTTLYSFAGGSDGGNPFASLISDGQGNLYGTAQGFQSNGTVFELSPAAGGGWTLTTLYTFQGGSDGAAPIANLVFDGHGNLFGTTVAGGGGNGSGCHLNGCGTVFELSPDGSGGWHKTEVHQFQGGPDGQNPSTFLIFDRAGNMYGTTDSGGGPCNSSSIGCGIVFEFSPVAGGGWKETIVHRFGRGTDGNNPIGGLVFDASGNLYGTTYKGGLINTACPFGCGIVYELSPAAGGGWTEKGLHAFAGSSDGASPLSGLTFDRAGNLYGTTFAAGAHGNGLVYRLVPNASGGWTEQVLYSFLGHPDGAIPEAGVVLDAAGNLYGTTPAGGASCGCGTVFKLTPANSGFWTFTLLYSFTGGNDGREPNPNGPLVLDSTGKLFGITNTKGSGLKGTAFELAP